MMLQPQKLFLSIKRNGFTCCFITDESREITQYIKSCIQNTKIICFINVFLSTSTCEVIGTKVCDIYFLFNQKKNIF